MLRKRPEVTDPKLMRAEIERCSALSELQDHPALRTALSDRERAADRKLIEWERGQDRSGRRRRLKSAKRAERREQRTTEKLARTDQQDRQWFQQALSARRRASTPDAQLARVFRRNTLTARALYSVVVLGMVWAAINVQGNLVPDRDPSNPLFWLSFGIEAMFSVPLILIMIHAQTASEIGEETDRGTIVLLEGALLGGSIALNAGPHYFAGEIGRGLEYSAAPVMIGVAIWLHAWLSRRYARLISKLLTRIPHTDTAGASDALGSTSSVASSQRLAPAEPAALPGSHRALLGAPAALAPSIAARTEVAGSTTNASDGGCAPVGAAGNANPTSLATSRSEVPEDSSVGIAGRTPFSQEGGAMPTDAAGSADTVAASSRTGSTPATISVPGATSGEEAVPRTAFALPDEEVGASHLGFGPGRDRAGSASAPGSAMDLAPRAPSASARTSAVVRALPIARTEEDVHDEFDRIAHRIVAADLVKKKTPEQVATVLRMLDQNRPHAEITRATATDYSGGIHHKTIKTIAAAAEEVKVPVRAVR